MESKKKPGVLRRRSEFLLLAKKGKRVTPERWLVINYLKNDLEQTRYGWTIPKQVGKAVIRNRLKRWCRVIATPFSTHPKLQSLDINVFVRPVDEKFYRKIQFAEFKKSLEKGLLSLCART